MATTDAEKNKVAGILGYIIFFLPLLMAPESKFAKYHANQGLLLLIVAVAIHVLANIVPFFGWLVIAPVGNIFLLVLWIIGILNASKGEMKALPVIGGYQIIK